jgi:hypothetical protein
VAWLGIGTVTEVTVTTTIHKGMQMNEKFKQLALKAKMATADFDAGSYYVATPEQMQLFAESIVQECADIATINQYQPFTTGTYVIKHFEVDE